MAGDVQGRQRPVLRVYSEVGADGGCLLYTFDPPGLLARGAGAAEAMETAVRETAALRDFLEECGCLGLLEAQWPPDQPPGLLVAETYSRRGAVAHGGTKATFARDLIPVSPEEIPRYLRLLAHSRVKLLKLKEAIPEDAYGFRSLPHRMTVDDQLRHIAGCERWYLAKLWPEMAYLPRSRDVWHKLELNREQAVKKLGGMTAEEMGVVRKVGSETWTARKVFRRLMYHEKFHRDCILRDLRLARVEVAPA